jgi:hypothetical protein
MNLHRLVLQFGFFLKKKNRRKKPSIWFFFWVFSIDLDFKMYQFGFS